MPTKEDLILQGISLLLRSYFSVPARFKEIHHANLCEDTNRWFEQYDGVKITNKAGRS